MAKLSLTNCCKNKFEKHVITSEKEETLADVLEIDNSIMLYRVENLEYSGTDEMHAAPRRTQSYTIDLTINFR